VRANRRHSTDCVAGHLPIITTAASDYKDIFLWSTSEHSYIHFHPVLAAYVGVEAVWPSEVDTPGVVGIVYRWCNGPRVLRLGGPYKLEVNLYPYGKYHLFEKGIEAAVEKKEPTKIVKLKLPRRFEKLEISEWRSRKYDLA
jgi:hypothetical protein